MALSFCYPPHAPPRACPRTTPFPAPRTGCPHAPAPRRNGAAVLPGLRPLRPCRVAQVARMRLRRTPPVPVQLRRPRPAKVLHFNELCSAPCQKARRRALFLVWYRHGWARRPSPLLQPEADFPCSLPEEKHDADLDDVKAIESTDPPVVFRLHFVR